MVSETKCLCYSSLKMMGASCIDILTRRFGMINNIARVTKTLLKESGTLSGKLRHFFIKDNI